MRGVDFADIFLAEGISIAMSELRILLNFKNITPRFQPTQDGEQVINIVKHNTIVLDPALAKALATTLNDYVQKYEQQFGHIKDRVQKNKTKNEKVTIQEKPNYFG